MLSHFNKLNMILSSKSSPPNAVDFLFRKHFTAPFVNTHSTSFYTLPSLTAEHS